MKEKVIQPVVHPFMKLAQANMELWSKFSSSSEVTSQATRDVQGLLEQAQSSATKLAQSHAFTEFMQGLVKNYTDFVSEWNQSACSMLSQGQATLVQQAQEATADAIEATDLRVRRTRQTA